MVEDKKNVQSVASQESARIFPGRPPRANVGAGNVNAPFRVKFRAATNGPATRGLCFLYEHHARTSSTEPMLVNSSVLMGFCAFKYSF